MKSNFDGLLAMIIIATACVLIAMSIFYNNIEQFVSRKPLNNNNNIIQNEQIIMLFYQSHDMTNY